MIEKKSIITGWYYQSLLLGIHFIKLTEFRTFTYKN